jgi:hypothetical protein
LATAFSGSFDSAAAMVATSAPNGLALSCDTPVEMR